MHKSIYKPAGSSRAARCGTPPPCARACRSLSHTSPAQTSRTIPQTGHLAPARRGGDTVRAALRPRGSTAVSSTCCRVVVICLTTSAWYFVCQPCTPHGYRYGTTAAPEAAPEVAPKVAPFTAQHDGQLYAADGCKRGRRAWDRSRPARAGALPQLKGNGQIHPARAACDAQCRAPRLGRPKAPKTRRGIMPREQCAIGRAS